MVLGSGIGDHSPQLGASGSPGRVDNRPRRGDRAAHVGDWVMQTFDMIDACIGVGIIVVLCLWLWIGW